MRRKLLESGEIREGIVTLNDLKKAVMVCNTLSSCLSSVLNMQVIPVYRLRLLASLGQSKDKVLQLCPQRILCHLEINKVNAQVM